jgi:tellurite resistance protein TerC
MTPLSETPLVLWIIFIGLFAATLVIDLGIGRKRLLAYTMKEAAAWSVVWIAAALVFNLAVYWAEGRQAALEFLAGYLIEKSLSVDNLFVFVMIFNYFAVDALGQIRVLKWGIIGALVMRAVFIALGAAILSTFHWAVYVFGAFLVYTGIHMVAHQGDSVDPSRNPIVKWSRRILPITERYDGHHFTVRVSERFYFTPLFIVLLVVESTDVVFAVDSIPAIYGITRDPFIVYSSNAFAIMGLRALYFLLAGMLELFRYLKLGVALVLVFVGLKMCATDWIHISIEVSLSVVFLLLSASVAASIIARRVDARGGGAT